jgi:hypothetical protein
MIKIITHPLLLLFGIGSILAGMIIIAGIVITSRAESRAVASRRCIAEDAKPLYVHPTTFCVRKDRSVFYAE